MKPFALVASALCLALAGCESVRDATSSVRERLAARTAPHTRVFATESRVLYAATRSAITEMGYRFLRGGPAQGEIDAVSDLDTDNSLRTTRQISMKIRLVPVPDGTEVRVVLTEVVEDDFNKGAGRSTESPLHDTPQYEVLFRHIEQALAALPKG
ncbi:MAG TPA: hypothetical protein VMC06_00255 [Opitutaceae bacterium]|nr:hypothetical protein [Opitutaceae bacterium]